MKLLWVEVHGGNRSSQCGPSCQTWYEVWVRFEEPLSVSCSSWAHCTLRGT